METKFQNDKSKVIILSGIIIAMSILVTAGGRDINYDENLFNISLVSVNDSLWEIDNATQYMQPKNLDAENRTVRVWDLIVESPDSIIIGGFINETEPFATITGTEFFFPIVNTTRYGIQFSRETFIIGDYDGMQILGNVNINQNANSSADVASSDYEGNGNILLKYNKNYFDPYLNVHGAAFGNMNYLTTSNNSFDGSFGSNQHRFGFYTDLKVAGDASILDFNNKSFGLEINRTRVKLNYDGHIETTLYFNQTYNSSTAPIAKDNKIALFGRDDNNLYVRQSTGDVRRIELVPPDPGVQREVINSTTTIINSTDTSTFVNYNDASTTLMGVSTINKTHYTIFTNDSTYGVKNFCFEGNLVESC